MAKGLKLMEIAIFERRFLALLIFTTEHLGEHCKHKVRYEVMELEIIVEKPKKKSLTLIISGKTAAA